MTGSNIELTCALITEWTWGSWSRPSSLSGAHAPAANWALPRLQPKPRGCVLLLCTLFPTTCCYISSCRAVSCHRTTSDSVHSLECCIPLLGFEVGGGAVAGMCPAQAALETQQNCSVPDVEVHWVDNPECKARFFFQPHTQAAAVPRFTQSSGTDKTRASSHLALVWSIFLPPMGPDS